LVSSPFPSLSSFFRQPSPYICVQSFCAPFCRFFFIWSLHLVICSPLSSHERSSCISIICFSSLLYNPEQQHRYLHRRENLRSRDSSELRTKWPRITTRYIKNICYVFCVRQDNTK
jgi:hypothetical protein